MQLNQLLAAPGFSAWLEGEPLDIDRLLYGENGRPRVSVISIAHLDDQERMFFVSLLLNEIVGWMRSQRGTSSLRALVYFDEIFGFLPPVANPPSKAPLLTLLKQARAFGLGSGGRDAESGRSRLQGAGQRGHVDARPAADRSRQGARARRTRRRGRQRRRGASIGPRWIACCRRSASDSSCCTTSTNRAGRVRDAVDAFVPSRTARARRDQDTCSAAVPGVPEVPRSSERRRCRRPVANPWNTWNRCERRPSSIPPFSSSLCPGATAYVPMLLGVARDRVFGCEARPRRDTRRSPS